jgi:hypothetical protein
MDWLPSALENLRNFMDFTRKPEIAAFVFESA